MVVVVDDDNDDDDAVVVVVVVVVGGGDTIPVCSSDINDDGTALNTPDGAVVTTVLKVDCGCGYCDCAAMVDVVVVPDAFKTLLKRWLSRYCACHTDCVLGPRMVTIRDRVPGIYSFL